MKNKAIILAIASCITLALTSCSISGSKNDISDNNELNDNITIGFSQVGAESDWRTANSKSMKSTFTEEKGYNLFFNDGQQKQENQIAAIRDFIQQKVDYIVLAPIIEKGWDEVLQEAKDAGIPVIIVDRMVDVEDNTLYTSYVGSDFQLAAEKSAEWLNQYLIAKNIANANIVNIQGNIGSTAQIKRTKELQNACSNNSNMTLLAEETGEFTRAKGKEIMEEFLLKYDNINVVWCENDNEAFGAIEAIEQSGKKVGMDIENGDIMILSFDAVSAGLSLVMKNKIALDTECNPLHGPIVEYVIRKIEEGEIPNRFIYVDDGLFAIDKTVESVKVRENEYGINIVTPEIIDSRGY